jgi:hypothetical protein
VLVDHLRGADGIDHLARPSQSLVGVDADKLAVEPPQFHRFDAGNLEFRYAVFVPNLRIRRPGAAGRKRHSRGLEELPSIRHCLSSNPDSTTSLL